MQNNYLPFTCIVVTRLEMIDNEVQKIDRITCMLGGNIQLHIDHAIGMKKYYNTHFVLSVVSEKYIGYYKQTFHKKNLRMVKRFPTVQHMYNY